jgi:hypothetical protein
MLGVSTGCRLHLPSANENTLRFQYEHLGERHGLTVTASGEPSAVPGTFTWQVVVPARGTWSTCLQVVPSIRDQAVPPLYRCGEPIEHIAPARCTGSPAQSRAYVSGGSDSTRLPTFHAAAADRTRTAFMPDTTWPANGYPPGSSRGYWGAPVSMPSTGLDTSSAVRSRSPSLSHLTHPLRLFLIAHHDGLQTTQHEVV